MFNGDHFVTEEESELAKAIYKDHYPFQEAP